MGEQTSEHSAGVPIPNYTFKYLPLYNVAADDPSELPGKVI